jgi:hypothetical protein
MSEESTRRLEKAMAKLAETSAQQNGWLAAHEERLAAHEESLAAHKERLAAIERTNEILEALAADAHQLLANMQRRVTGLEEANATVVELLGRHHEGITELRAAQANADAKIALLAESQAHTGRRLDALIDIVRGRLNGQSGSS